jgi:aminopeptidase N
MRVLARWGIAVLAVCRLWADNYPRQPGVDVQHYLFRVTLRDDSDEISGETTVSIRFAAGVTSVALDLASPADGKGMTVTEVTADGAARLYTHRSDRIEIPLAPAAEAGEIRRFTLKYHGIPANGLKIGNGAPVAAHYRPSLRQSDE